LGITAIALWRARGTARRQVLGASAFLVVALASVYPRPGTNNFADTMPLTLTATMAACALAGAPPHTRKRTRAVVHSLIAASGLAGLFVVTAHAVVGYSSRTMTRDAAAPFTGLAVPANVSSEAHQIRVALQRKGNGTVFIIRPDASLWYFAAGLRNPLPFDYSEISDFGSGGERAVIRLIQRRAVEWVCLPNDHAQLATVDVRPRRLEAWVRHHYHYEAKAAGCDLYQRPLTVAPTPSAKPQPDTGPPGQLE
jgi:hypothetical protein